MQSAVRYTGLFVDYLTEHVVIYVWVAGCVALLLSLKTLWLILCMVFQELASETNQL